MRNVITLVLIMALAAAFVVFWDSLPEVFVEMTQQPGDELPTADSYMKEMETRKYNDLGAQTHRITATEGRYFRRQDRFELDNPHLISYGDTPDTIPWHLRAKTARTAKRGAEVIMEEDVYGWQTMVDGKRELITEKLVFNPSKQEVKTNKKVSIQTPKGKTTGVGMIADLKNQRYELLSKVKGTHYGQ